MVRNLLAFLLLAASPAGAQEWRQANDVEIRLSNFDIEPGTIRLKAGEPVRLRLINMTPGNYAISAGDFFIASNIRQRDRRFISGGSINVPSGEVRELVLVPARGRYTLHSSNLIYRILGMRGTIEVD